MDSQDAALLKDKVNGYCSLSCIALMVIYTLALSRTEYEGCYGNSSVGSNKTGFHPVSFLSLRSCCRSNPRYY